MASKKPSLSAALREVTGWKPPPAAVTAPATGTVLAVASKPPARQGLKVVSGHFDPAVSKQLKLLAIERDKNLQELLAEAINDLFIKHKKSPIA